jgi:hypothetical protein
VGSLERRSASIDKSASWHYSDSGRLKTVFKDAATTSVAESKTYGRRVEYTKVPAWRQDIGGTL